MDHVNLVKDFCGYKEGTLFAIVDDRAYWGQECNMTSPRWISDGKWIGCFEVGMPRSEFTYYCITQDGYDDHRHLFKHFGVEE